VIGFNGIGNEWIMSLRIGWFSYYMIWIACVYFLPAELLRRVGWVLTWPSQTLANRMGKSRDQADGGRLLGRTTAIAGGLAIVLLALVIGRALELPGSGSVGALTAMAVLGAVFFALARRRYEGVFPFLAAAGLANLFLWLTIEHSSVRFQYYNRTAAYMRHGGKVEAAEAAVKKARFYLPPGRRRPGERTGRDRS
jgi:hypothetical protein